MPQVCGLTVQQFQAMLRLAVGWLLLTASVFAQSGPPPRATPTGTAPQASSLPGGSQTQQLFIKPGHWLAARVDLAAGDDDLRGTLGGGWLDEKDAPLAYPPLRYVLRSEQPAVVPKLTRRAIEQRLFVPNDYDGVSGRGMAKRESRLHDAVALFRLDSTGLFGSSLEVRRTATVLRDHQALFVVLAARPGDYAWLDTFDTLAAAHTPTTFPEFDAHYRLAIVDDAAPPPLPTSIQGWTTTAYVLWDGYDLTKLSDEQRTALVDWLHWGGTLIVAGPGTLDSPVDAPLQSFLPASSHGVVELDAAALAPLAAMPSDGIPLDVAQRKWTGLRLQPHADAVVTLGTKEIPLVVERRLGRGRIIATAFRLTQSELFAWPSYAGLFNTHLMRRPARVWTLHPKVRDLAIAAWADDRALPTDDELRQGVPDRWFDPARISALRFFGRGDATTAARRTLFNLDRPLGPGVAAWRDDDELAAMARNAIRASSGIFIPSVATISWLLGGYVLAVVPLNWLLFRSFRKPEWAWISLPLLAVAYSAFIIRAAELDLGFARSTSETALIEIQPGYERAHVTRFTSLYNSLGTEYQVVGEDPTTLTLPFPVSLDAGTAQNGRAYRLTQSDDATGRRTTTLLGTVVDSNSIAAVRSEQMAPLGGALTATRLPDSRVRLNNNTRLELRHVRLLGPGRGYIAAIRAGETIEVTLEPDLNLPADDSTAESFHRLFVASTPAGSLSLTAVTPTELPGVRIEPEPSQRRRAAIVVARLLDANEPPPAKDVNTQRSIEAQIPPAP